MEFGVEVQQHLKESITAACRGATFQAVKERDIAQDIKATLAEFVAESQYRKSRFTAFIPRASSFENP